jgi:hypothetical protein
MNLFSYTMYSQTNLIEDCSTTFFFRRFDSYNDFNFRDQWLQAYCQLLNLIHAMRIKTNGCGVTVVRYLEHETAVMNYLLFFLMYNIGCVKADSLLICLINLVVSFIRWFLNWLAVLW